MLGQLIISLVDGDQSIDDDDDDDDDDTLRNLESSYLFK